MNKKNIENNIAFIDAQNVHLGTASENWKIDYNKFRIYLKDKFNVTEAYYFLGFLSEDEENLYKKLQKAGFIVVFREHTSHLKGKKKGNVDVDIVFDIMKRIVGPRDFSKIILVSGDGDYIKLVNYLIQKQLLKKILFPNKHYSSLYNKIKKEFGMNLGVKGIKSKIGFIEEEKQEKIEKTKEEIIIEKQEINRKNQIKIQQEKNKQKQIKQNQENKSKKVSKKQAQKKEMS